MSTSTASPSPTAQNTLAQTLKSLHIPGNPLILTNVWDAITARAIASLPETRALATASLAIAAAAGLEDADLDFETNMRAVRAISKVARNAGKPLTVDMQDGFGERLEEAVGEVVRAGGVGCNLEDLGRELGGKDGQGKGELYSIADQQDRIRRVLKIAAEEGVPDFVINARTDALVVGRSSDEAIERGKAYLEAGAHNVFIWGGKGRGGWRREEVERAVRALDGRLNVLLDRMTEGHLTVSELREIGVARISLGPRIMLRTQKVVADEAGAILRGEDV
ncbi:Phosphoenolpyruvate/pyruvate domain-containing protein [Lophiostoma macrostomum CBS 122681]|uniref:Phosphoenolpyruvate/pyruvate domain-containing protein n=1 Tax=Lophiostoma macrostomum CBS 122681 TaxID=1314788 RepID=A0A6A6TIH0_9PLEO|nr:Phosphoenolpyruvate/pyruvate domain-containing protein [Lophiostoma macrostomum CBS 122681]